MFFQDKVLGINYVRNINLFLEISSTSRVSSHCTWVIKMETAPIVLKNTPNNASCFQTDAPSNKDFKVCTALRWNRNVVILMKFSSLTALEVVIWQLPVQPVMMISSKWEHFRFSVLLSTMQYIPAENFAHTDSHFVLCCFGISWIHLYS